MLTTFTKLHKSLLHHECSTHSYKHIISVKFNQHCVILYEWASTDLSNGGKELKTASDVTTRGGGFSEGIQVWLCHQHLRDIHWDLSTTLIEDRQCDYTSEWPHQPVITFTLHHVDIECHMGANSTIDTIEADSHAERVAIQTGVDRRTELRYCCSSDSIFTTLLEIPYSPVISATADTSLELAQYSFIK